MKILKAKDFVENAVLDYLGYCCVYPGEGNKKLAVLEALREIKNTPREEWDGIMARAGLSFPFVCDECGRKKDIVIQIGGDVRQETVQVCHSCLGNLKAVFEKAGGER